MWSSTTTATKGARYLQPAIAAFPALPTLTTLLPRNGTVLARYDASVTGQDQRKVLSPPVWSDRQRSLQRPLSQSISPTSLPKSPQNANGTFRNLRLSEVEGLRVASCDYKRSLATVGLFLPFGVRQFPAEIGLLSIYAERHLGNCSFVATSDRCGFVTVFPRHTDTKPGTKSDGIFEDVLAFLVSKESALEDPKNSGDPATNDLSIRKMEDTREDRFSGLAVGDPQHFFSELVLHSVFPSLPTISFAPRINDPPALTTERTRDLLTYERGGGFMKDTVKTIDQLRGGEGDKGRRGSAQEMVAFPQMPQAANVDSIADLRNFFRDKIHAAMSESQMSLIALNLEHDKLMNHAQNISKTLRTSSPELAATHSPRAQPQDSKAHPPQVSKLPQNNITEMRGARQRLSSPEIAGRTFVYQSGNEDENCVLGSVVCDTTEIVSDPQRQLDRLVELRLLETALGGGDVFSSGGPGKGLTSRLHRNVLPYQGVHSCRAQFDVVPPTSFPTTMTDGGSLFQIQFKVDGLYAQDCLSLVDKNLERLASKEMKDAELSRIKKQLRFHFWHALEHPFTRLSYILALTPPPHRSKPHPDSLEQLPNLGLVPKGDVSGLGHVPNLWYELQDQMPEAVDELIQRVSKRDLHFAAQKLYHVPRASVFFAPARFLTPTTA